MRPACSDRGHRPPCRAVRARDTAGSDCMPSHQNCWDAAKDREDINPDPSGTSMRRFTPLTNAECTLRVTPSDGPVTARTSRDQTRAAVWNSFSTALGTIMLVSQSTQTHTTMVLVQHASRIGPAPQTGQAGTSSQLAGATAVGWLIRRTLTDSRMEEMSADSAHSTGHCDPVTAPWALGSPWLIACGGRCQRGCLCAWKTARSWRKVDATLLPSLAPW
jgi:hypothetical protein